MQICFDMSQDWKLPMHPFVKSVATVFIISKHLWKFLHSIPSLPCPLGRPTLLCLCGCLQDEAEQGDMCSSHPLTHTRWIWEILITILKMHPPLLYEVLTFLRCCHCVGFAGGHTFCSRTYSAGTVVQGLSPHMLWLQCFSIYTHELHFVPIALTIPEMLHLLLNSRVPHF